MKKNYLLLISAVLFTATISAQIKKGSISLGGQIFYYSSNADWNTSQPNQKNKNAVFGITTGKAVKENSVAGIAVTYGSGRVNNFYNGNAFINSKTDQYNFGIFYRRYKKLAKDFYFFGEGGAAYINNGQTDTDTLGGNKIKYSQAGGEISMAAGLSYRVFKKLHLEIIIPRIVNVQYAVSKTKSATQNFKQDQFLFNSSLNASPLNFLGVGFRVIL